MSTVLDVPRALPVAHLSPSSVRLYISCPEKWRRRYIAREYEPASAAMILGSSVGAAEAQADHVQIDTGERPPSDAVVDLFSDEWEDRIGREEIDWRSDKPGPIKDVGIAVVRAYDKTIAPDLKPVSVEREFSLQLEGVDWTYTGFLDLEEEDGGVVDRKVKGQRLSKPDADADIQPTSYLLARRAEGNPAPEFRFHVGVKTKTPYAEIVPTTRTNVQLDAFVDRLYAVSAEINWRMETGIWAGAVPGSWVCSERYCGYWNSCSMGGLR